MYFLCSMTSVTICGLVHNACKQYSVTWQTSMEKSGLGLLLGRLILFPTEKFAVSFETGFSNSLTMWMTIMPVFSLPLSLHVSIQMVSFCYSSSIGMSSGFSLPVWVMKGQFAQIEPHILFYLESMVGSYKLDFPNGFVIFPPMSIWMLFPSKSLLFLPTLYKIHHAWNYP